ncbi:MAG: hypothetical protein R6U36_09685 [Candidatus Fermentibacteraceae bacterium]
MNILSYYGFDRPPFLEIGALDSSDKISMYFADRRKELSVLEGLNAWGGSFAAVLTGQDGVGKTTLLRRFLADCPLHCFIRGDDIRDLPQVEDTCAEFSVYGEMRRKPISRMHEIAGKSDDVMVVVLDGQDFLKSFNVDDVAAIGEYVNSTINSASTFVYSSRDPIDELREAFIDPSSRLSRIFDEHIVLQPFGLSGVEDIRDLLAKRFHVDDHNRLPLTDGALELLEQFASGNMRELLRLTRRLLEMGYQREVSCPLTREFCIEHLVDMAKKQIASPVEWKMLEMLREHPMAVPDFTKLEGFGSERTNRRALERLEERRFVERDHSRHGVRQEWRLTDKSVLLLSQKPH